MSAACIHPARSNHRHGSAEGNTSICSFHAGFVLSGYMHIQSGASLIIERSGEFYKFEELLYYMSDGQTPGI
jgi:hypothetical protein